MQAQQKPPADLIFIEDYVDETGTVIPGIASRLGITPGTFRKWRMAGKGPSCFMLGKRVAARVEAIEKWIAEQEEAALRKADEVSEEMRPPEPRLYRPRTAAPRKQFQAVA